MYTLLGCRRVREGSVAGETGPVAKRVSTVSGQPKGAMIDGVVTPGQISICHYQQISAGPRRNRRRC